MPKRTNPNALYNSVELEMLSLIDGAYDLIEAWRAESPAQIEWKKNWLAKAREYA